MYYKRSVKIVVFDEILISIEVICFILFFYYLLIDDFFVNIKYLYY